MELLQYIHVEVKRFNETYKRDVKAIITTQTEGEANYYDMRANIHLKDSKNINGTTFLYSKFDKNWKLALNVYGFLCDSIIKKEYHIDDL